LKILIGILQIISYVDDDDDYKEKTKKNLPAALKKLQDVS